MAHSHPHTSPCLPEDNNAHHLLYAFSVTTRFMLAEVVGSFLSGSLALLADAGHMSTDTVTLPFALLAVQFSRRPSTIRHTFGWLRLTTLAAFVDTIVLVVTTILAVWETIERFRVPRPVEDGMMVAIVMTGLLADISSFWLLYHGSEEKSLSARAAALYVLGDLLGSIGAIIAALTIIWTGWIPTGPILSVLMSLLVLRSTWRLLEDNVNELLEGTPVSLGIAELKRHTCREIPKIRNVHHVHVWMVDEKPVMTLHVQVIPPYDHDVLLDQIQHYLMDRCQIEHATIQVEYQPCHGSDCHLNEGASDHSHHRY